MEKSANYKDKLLWVEGLLIECPFAYPLPDCPAIGLRELPLEERLSLAAKFTEDELDAIIEHHVSCLKKRESY